MNTTDYCRSTFSSRCQLLNCYFGFNGPLDPEPLGYGRDEIEIIYLSGNVSFCEEILDQAVRSGIIHPYRDVDGSGSDNPDTGEGGTGGGDGEDSSNTPDNIRKAPMWALVLAAWLVTST